MRYTQPLTADEQSVDAAMRQQHRSECEQDRALTLYRMARRASTKEAATERLDRVAELLTGVQL